MHWHIMLKLALVRLSWKQKVISIIYCFAPRGRAGTNQWKLLREASCIPVYEELSPKNVLAWLTFNSMIQNSVKVSVSTGIIKTLTSTSCLSKTVTACFEVLPTTWPPARNAVENTTNYRCLEDYTKDGSTYFSSFYISFCRNDVEIVPSERWHFPTRQIWAGLVNCFAKREAAASLVVKRPAVSFLFKKFQTTYWINPR